MLNSAPNTPLALPSVDHMTMQAADALLFEQWPALGELAEDYERCGNTHVYFLQDCTVVKVNKFRVIHITYGDDDEAVTTELARFLH